MIDHSVTETLGGNEVSRRLNSFGFGPTEVSRTPAGPPPRPGAPMRRGSEDCRRGQEGVVAEPGHRKRCARLRDSEPLHRSFSRGSARASAPCRQDAPGRERKIDPGHQRTGTPNSCGSRRGETDVQIKVNLQNLEKTFAEAQESPETREKELEQMRSLSNKPRS